MTEERHPIRNRNIIKQVGRKRGEIIDRDFGTRVYGVIRPMMRGQLRDLERDLFETCDRPQAGDQNVSFLMTGQIGHVALRHQPER